MNSCTFWNAEGYNTKLELLGVSTTYGNQSHDKTLRNAASMVKAAGLNQIKIVPGQNKPIVRQPLAASEVLGEPAWEAEFDIPFFDPEYVLADTKAVNILAETLLKSQQRLVLIATGPLTTYGLLLTLYPETKTNIERIVFMGGALGKGNWTSAAEFNVLSDPEAAKIVIDSGVPVYMVPLEIARGAIVTSDIVSKVENRLANSRFCQLIKALLLSFGQKTPELTHGREKGILLHDPCAVAYEIMPESFSLKPMHVEVITNDGPTLGQTTAI
ncbi:hypothetical protein EC973_004266 [Apophysomyces ossiformis]|uniref:Inosine/uridine-preferring nucleoside hydrolase domain-containing protein n=1 Tax=Apophysomyces ossiformis TaxID=679940 RepID=A0A8H7BLI9_9FUNG|nr:hypothetical protein EC973_004266 [Apophysomyces ossiformis]